MSCAKLLLVDYNTILHLESENSADKPDVEERKCERHIRKPDPWFEPEPRMRSWRLPRTGRGPARGGASSRRCWPQTPCGWRRTGRAPARSRSTERRYSPQHTSSSGTCRPRTASWCRQRRCHYQKVPFLERGERERERGEDVEEKGSKEECVCWSMIRQSTRAH